MNYPISPLLTDLYQLTMMQAYHDSEMQKDGVFELFFRKLPAKRKFLVACGLPQVLEYLESLSFQTDDIDFLHKTGRFSDSFLDSLRELRFTGSVHAMAEGTIFFPDEPIIRVTAPLPLAQLVETRVINIMQFQTMIASKAVRMKQLMPDKVLVDYGLRRSHGAEAGVLAARASYLAGFTGTATVLAGKMFDIPIYGTMAHSFIQAHESERSAFNDFVASHPGNTVILLDTYDTEKAAAKVVEMAPDWKERGIQIRGVRLDSGDMIELSRRVRRILDDGGLTNVPIFASGNLDEYSLHEFQRQNAPVDGFGIGSKMTTSADVPYYDCAYKLVEYAGEGRRKLSKKKATWPGRKQVFRNYSTDNIMQGDILALDHEEHDGTKLIEQVMEKGKRTVQLPGLAESRARLCSQLATLPAFLQSDEDLTVYSVTPSGELTRYAEKVSERMLKKNI